MADVFRQWVDAFDSELEKTGCTLEFDAPSRTAQVRATIAGAADTEDQAVAVISTASKLPAADEGKCRFVLLTPNPLNVASSNIVFWHLRNASAAFIEVFMDTSEVVRVFSPATILSSAGFNLNTSTALVSNTRYTFEVAWRKNSFFRLWLDGVLKLDQALSGATGDAVPAGLRIGIDHYDGAGTDDQGPYTYEVVQLNDNADATLGGPIQSSFYSRVRTARR